MIRKELPALYFKSNRLAFRRPFGYFFVGKLHNKYAYELYLFPFNLIVRLWRFIIRATSTSEKKIN